MTLDALEGDESVEIEGHGNGPIDAFVNGLAQACGQAIRVLSYHEHAVGKGSKAQAVAFLELCIGDRVLYGVGQDSDIVAASLKAIISGVRRARAQSKREKSLPV